jgi:hypothetical protein
MKMALDSRKKCKRRFLSVQTKSAGIALFSGEVNGNDRLLQSKPGGVKARQRPKGSKKAQL